MSDLIEDICKANDRRVFEGQTVLGMASVPLADYENLWRLLHQCKAALSQQKAVGEVHRNSAGQISIRNIDGSSFDMSKHIGTRLYTAPPSTAQEAKYENLGNLSAVGPAYSKGMSCHDCRVEWIGCWDNFQCPKCGEGDIPND